MMDIMTMKLYGNPTIAGTIKLSFI